MRKSLKLLETSSKSAIANLNSGKSEQTVNLAKEVRSKPNFKELNDSEVLDCLETAESLIHNIKKLGLNQKEIHLAGIAKALGFELDAAGLKALYPISTEHITSKVFSLGFTSNLVQEILLESSADVVLFGGARGGGKTTVMLQDLYYFMCKEFQKENAKPFNAIILRNTVKDLDDVMNRVYEVFGKVGRHIKKDNIFQFDNGCILYFKAYSDTSKVQGKEYRWMAIEEIGLMDDKSKYEQLLATMRGGKSRVVLTGNPGGRGHKWLKQEFVDGKIPYLTYAMKGFKHLTAQYIPSVVTDNTKLIEADPAYLERTIKATEGTPSLRLAWLTGDWEYTYADPLFSANMFKFSTEFVKKVITSEGDFKFEANTKGLRIFQAWDLAQKTDSSHDFSACITIGVTANCEIHVLDVFQKKMDFVEICKTVAEYAQKWKASEVLIEEKGSGSSVLSQLNASGYKGLNLKGVSPQNRDKLDRASELKAFIMNSDLSITIPSAYNEPDSRQYAFSSNHRLRPTDDYTEFMTQLYAFPSLELEHDDFIDVFVYACVHVAKNIKKLSASREDIDRFKHMAELAAGMKMPNQANATEFKAEDTIKNSIILASTLNELYSTNSALQDLSCLADLI